MLEEKLGRDDLKRDKITIANAWNNVEYKAKTGRREATDKKIKEEENVQRLQEQLGGITDIVLFCGKKAQLISSKLTLTAKHILFIEHLGTLGLLSITKDVEGKPILSAKTQISSGCKTSKSSLQHENTRKRLEFIAHGLAESLEQAKG